MLTGPSLGAVHPVNGDEIILGRTASSFPIYDRGVSGRHTRIFRRQGAFWIEDLDSTNGTFVNGARVVRCRELLDGDRIQLGENTLLHVSLHDAAHQEAQRRMYDSAVFDGLTGLYNRAYFDQLIEREFAFALRHKTTIAVLFIDLDHFSEVNNTYGHQAGDAVLRTTAEAIEDAVRTEDVVARYGGEEFVLLARGLAADSVMTLAQRVRRAISDLSIPYEDQVLTVTGSIGVAWLDSQTAYEDTKQLIAAADQAMYRAKADGRDRCCYAVATTSASCR